MRGGYRPNSGRKKKADEQRIRDLLSPYRGETIACVLEIMRTAEKDSDRLAACKLLLAYDFGLPTASVQHLNEDGEAVPYINLVPYTPIENK